jgi:hypothetical protein
MPIPRKLKPAGRTHARDINVSLYPLTPEAIKGMFQISREDVKQIVASKPGKGKKK